MLGQALLLLGIVSIFASWLFKRNNNFCDSISDNETTMRVMKYTAVPGYFVHDDEPEGPDFRARTRQDLGLRERPYETDAVFNRDWNKLSSDQKAVSAIHSDWIRFKFFLKHLNELGQGKVEWKILLLVRHGEGQHNVKEKEVGRAEWERYWSRADGDCLYTWADARLTESGRTQAHRIVPHVSKWRPWRPGNVYTSPLARCLETTDIIWGHGMHDRYIRHPIVKENLRERFGVHTCDRRSTKSWIKSHYPWFTIEKDFTEKDQLWESGRRETEEEAAKRARAALHDIWKHDRSTNIAIVAHSGFIRALYAAIGHRDVWVAPGEMVPVLVKGEIIDVPDKK